MPHSWGAELSPGLGPQHGFGAERLFEKDVFGAFSGTDLEGWLRALSVDTVLIVGFYSHMCVSTSAREALVRGFDVSIDPDATGACEIQDPFLGSQTAADVRRSALLHLVNMGVRLEPNRRNGEPESAARSHVENQLAAPSHLGMPAAARR